MYRAGLLRFFSPVSRVNLKKQSKTKKPKQLKTEEKKNKENKKMFLVPKIESKGTSLMNWA